MHLGVNLAGYARAEMGLGQAFRGMADALKVAEISFHVLNLETGNPSRHFDFSQQSQESSDAPFDISILGVLPDNLASARREFPSALWRAPLKIAHWTWELSEAPDEFIRESEEFDEIWTPSRFVQTAFSEQMKIPVVRIPYAIHLDSRHRKTRQELKLSEEAYLFVSFFDTHSVAERKNPEGSISAFQSAFAPDDSKVGLVIKVNNPEWGCAALARLEEQIRGWPNIQIRAETLDRFHTTALLAACDCYVSLHRSEGFGLVGAEAMFLGKPTILTAWSGNLDYMTPDNCAPINARLVELSQDYGPYRKGQRWAEPNLNEAADWMIRLKKDPSLGQKLGEAGQATILTQFSPRAVGAQIRQRLLALGAM